MKKSIGFNDRYGWPERHLWHVHARHANLEVVGAWSLNLNTTENKVVLMLTAFPTITDAEFAEACQVLEVACGGRLDGTTWLGVKWDCKGALHIKKQYAGKEPWQREEAEEAEFETAQQDAGSGLAEEEVKLCIFCK